MSHISKKERITDTWDNMDEKRHAKWTKPDTEGHIHMKKFCASHTGDSPKQLSRAHCERHSLMKGVRVGSPTSGFSGKTSPIWQ